MAERKHYKVGDKVRIREWDDMEKEFGKCPDGSIPVIGSSFQPHMKHLCGREAVITDIIPDEYSSKECLPVKLKFYNSSGTTKWYYTLSMIEPIDNVIENRAKEVKMEKIKYSVGDRVIIRDYDDIEREYGTADKCPGRFFKTMKHLCGRTATIVYIDSDQDQTKVKVKLDFDDKSGDIDWFYSTAMIKPAFSGGFLHAISW